MQDAAVFARDSLEGPAMIVGAALASGTPLETVEYWPRLLAGVSVDDVNEAARIYLDLRSEPKGPVVTGYLLPPAQEKAEEQQAETKEEKTDE